MRKTSLIASASLFVIVLLAGTFVYFRNTGSPAVTETSSVSTASWVSPAASIGEVTKEANLVVRARVVKPPVPRIFRESAPEMKLSNGEATVVGSQVSEMVFSDTTFEVLTTYVGKSDSQIMVMQTGGPQPDNPTNITEMADDPLYQVGEEYILFLVDISGDSVQAPDRTLYRIVNPSGRYQINGETVRTYGENVATDLRPTTLTDLERQITSAVKQ